MITAIKNKWIFLVAAASLFLALPTMPYAYYQLLRWFVTGVCIYGCINECIDKKFWFWFFIIVGVIFNPILPIHFGKEVWKVVDLIIGIFFIIYCFLNLKKEIKGKDE